MQPVVQLLQTLYCDVIFSRLIVSFMIEKLQRTLCSNENHIKSHKTHRLLKWIVGTLWVLVLRLTHPRRPRGLGSNTAAKRLRMRQFEHFRSLFQSHFPVRSKSPARSRLHSVCSLWFSCSALCCSCF